MNKNIMRILFCGDVVGRSGREAVQKHVPYLKSKYEIDFIVVNGENSAAGFGITPAICSEFYGYGVDVITTGNHIWDQREILSYISTDARLLKPANYPTVTPGRGATLIQHKELGAILVVNLMARLFMDSLDDPFAVIEEILKPYELGRNVSAILVDFHGEATSEKMAMGYHLNGRVSMVVGTHTHIPTGDARILSQGTAYMTDAGMCGDYDSIVGMDKEISLSRFTTKLPTRLKAAEGEGTLCGVIVDLSRETGLALKISSVILGGCLPERLPIISA